MKFFLVVLLLSGFAQAVFGQTDSDQSKMVPYRWRGLTLDESTPAETVHLFGLPEHDSPDRLSPIYLPPKWITDKSKQKVFRQLEFKKIEGVKSVKFSFQDDKLVMIEIEPAKEINADSLGSVYGLKFELHVSGTWEGIKPQEFERHQGKAMPATFPGSFNLITVSRRAFIGALIDNGTGLFTRESSEPRTNNGIPGKVKKIQLVSRKLENRDGADSLQ